MNMVMGFGLVIVLAAVVAWHTVTTPKRRPATVVVGGDLPERVAAVLGCDPNELRPR